ncbi:hypothetical protein CASFOL_002104 [Castilleja foliolosa]|uniref:Uncharacterized protein n=1 Tax=Castilleja foliolosa TaxID=1961234 RepID=A0ABD3EDA6_9LAMI
MLRIAEILKKEQKINEDKLLRIAKILNNDTLKKEEAGLSGHFFQNQKPKTESKNETVDKNKLLCDHCKKIGHLKKGCFKLIGFPDWYENNPKYQEKGKKGTAVTKIDEGDIAGEELTFAAAASVKPKPPIEISNQQRRQQLQRVHGRAGAHASNSPPSTVCLGKKPVVALKNQPPQSGAATVAEEDHRPSRSPRQAAGIDHLAKISVTDRSSARPITVADGKMKKTMMSPLTSSGGAGPHGMGSFDDGPSGPKKTGPHEAAQRNGSPGSSSAGPKTGSRLGPLNGPGLGSGPFNDQIKVNI